MDINEVIDRLKLYLRFKTDKELADYLGVVKATVSSWKKRNTIDWQLVFELCKDIDLNYLIRGETTNSDESAECKPDSNVDMRDILRRLELLEADKVGRAEADATMRARHVMGSGVGEIKKFRKRKPV